MITLNKNDDHQISADELCTICSWLRYKSVYHIIKNMVKIKTMKEKVFTRSIKFYSKI